MQNSSFSNFYQEYLGLVDNVVCNGVRLCKSKYRDIPINRSTVQELCGFTDQQARRTIEKMKEENIIEMSNGGRYAKYILKEI